MGVLDELYSTERGLPQAVHEVNPSVFQGPPREGQEKTKTESVTVATLYNGVQHGLLKEAPVSRFSHSALSGPASRWLLGTESRTGFSRAKHFFCQDVTFDTGKGEKTHRNKSTAL